MYKQANLSFSITAQAYGDDVTAVQFSTQDKNSAKLIFTIKEGKQPLDLTDVEGLVDLVMGDKSVFDDNKATVTAPLDGKLEYTLTSEQIRHSGRAKGELQLVSKEGQAIGGFRFNFTIKPALVDEYSGPIKEFYIEDLEAVKQEVKKKADAVVLDIDEFKVEIDSRTAVIEEQLDSLDDNVGQSTVLQVDAAKKDTTGQTHSDLDSRIKAEVGKINTKQGELTAQLAEMPKTINGKAPDSNGNVTIEGVPTIPSNLLKKVRNKILPPERFTWKSYPINIYKNRLGEFSTDFNFDSFAHKGKIYYVNVSSGNDLNDGLTPQTALKSIHVARLKNDVDVIEVADGFYGDETGFNNASLLFTNNRNITIRASEGANPIVTTARLLTWSKTANRTNIYQASRTKIATIYDRTNLDKDGDMLPLVKVLSIEECDNTPNSYYYDGSIMHIHTFDKRQPARDSIIPFMELYNFASVGNFRIALKGIKLWGGISGAVHVQCGDTGEKPLFVAEDCEFKYASEGNGGLTSLGYDCISNRCKNAQNKRDGFNYHKYASKIPNTIEIDCKGYKNGIGRGSNEDNGSTMHDGGKIIRINGEYYENEGPNAHEVTAGTQSWNLGCQAYKSLASTQSRKVNYQIETGEMFLENCVGFESYRNYYATSNGTIYEKGNAFDDNLKEINKDAGGSLIQY